MNRIFELGSLWVMPFWLTMIFLPRLKLTQALNRGLWGPIGPALVYAALVLPRMASVLPAVLQPKLPAIAALLATPEGATIAWLHFLAFDLFLGRYIYWDARERELPALAVAPILFFTLMLGPIGLLAYLGLRAALSRRTATPAAEVRP